ncbi:MAG: M20/M25/M40 family metallo-hydrolase [Chloroflexi bacterium]|nr:M20/M25/M40 family metallo-hydrolase [Chloroflexota bacterium]MCI0577318.1 M20/M25/M40 family metallo-hydrolase [Chloroflexota bacterium]MCI0646819.1 M20/M25/M40 family metallo-hydrolase [Chloroflexota bacterium]MCI0728121.1 M20/M25/M40 family metallo-hydrolase [Chloroflexota bacterium]
MNRVQKIAQHAQVQAALAAFKEEVAPALDLAIRIQQIPAPTFAEARRADFVEARFVSLGLSDVYQDALHNVYARFPGAGAGPPVVLTAHSDTVFPAETDLSIRRADGRVYGPGLADNSLGVAGLLLLAQTLTTYGLRPAADLWLAVNVREEGLGDLQGMQAVVGRFPGAAAFIVVEGGSYGQIYHEATGVRRYRVAVATPGGHSWGDFGRPSAVHVLGRLITAIAGLAVPAEPKTSYNVGVVEGGTTVNTIAASASMQLDLRSADPTALAQLVAAVENMVAQANEPPEVVVNMTQIGNRPAGEVARDAPLVSWAAAALQQMGCRQVRYMAGSTDANVPISRGQPAVCIGLAEAGNTHRLDEYLDPAQLPAGLGQLLLLTLAAAGCGF